MTDLLGGCLGVFAPASWHTRCLEQCEEWHSTSEETHIQKPNIEEERRKRGIRKGGKREGRREESGKKEGERERRRKGRKERRTEGGKERGKEGKRKERVRG